MIVKIYGGLGNQLFQYAFARNLLEKYGDSVWLDCREFENNNFATVREYKLDAFNIKLPRAPLHILNQYRLKENTFSKIFKRVTGNQSKILKDIVIESDLDYCIEYQRKAKYYKGHWQSEKYFSEIRNILLDEFTLKDKYKPMETALFDQIRNSQSVGIHVRRGDYVHNPKANAYHGLLKEKYYLDAINKIQEEVNGAVFFVFSDEIDWVKENMFQNSNVTYVNSLSAESDLYLMSLCKNNIIANSTFSWWAAYLNNNVQKKIVAPRQWFLGAEVSDLIPDSWTLI